MIKKVKDLRAGIRLKIRKPPKVEIPKNVYNRKVKHRRGLEDEKFRPLFYPSGLSLHLNNHIRNSITVNSVIAA